MGKAATLRIGDGATCQGVRIIAVRGDRVTLWLDGQDVRIVRYRERPIPPEDRRQRPNQERST